MSGPLALGELLLRKVDVAKGLDLFEELLVLGNVEDNRRAVTSLGQNDGSLGLADALDEA